jgi:predicted dehydrogenase
MIQQETRKLLLPTLAWRLLPAVERIRELLADGKLGAVQLLQWDRSFLPESGKAPPDWDGHPLLDLWDLLRALGGEVRDISAVGPEEEDLRPDDALTLTGRFETAGQFRVLLSPARSPREEALLVRGERGEAMLTFLPNRQVWLRIRLADGEEAPDAEPWDATHALASHVDQVFSGARPRVTWQDATRCLELFEAARQSVRRRRVIPMHYEEFTETANFKSVMASLGCGVLLLALLVLIALLIFKIPLKPWVLGVVLPLLAIFLLLQALRWIVPKDVD